MASSLGLYIETDLIKYAKVSKERDDIKVESFGIRFYENGSLEETIKQIVEETYSYKTPISVNLSSEMYTYFDVFALLGKNYLPKVIKTEFEMECTDKGYNPGVFETRYAVVDDLEDSEKLRVINISANKIELNRRIQSLSPYKLTTVSPISMDITNIARLEPKEGALIVNLEESTVLTTITDQKIYDVQILDQGSSDVLGKIEKKENSYAKAYEACKNTTIYTAEGKSLSKKQTYLADIVPTLDKIIDQVSQKVSESPAEIKKVYLTGTLSCINNIDLYFQESLPTVECEILKPYFILNDGGEINIKDYIEVNSAIALGVQGLGIGVSGMNFKKNSLGEMLKSGFSNGALSQPVNLKNLVTPDFSDPMTKSEKKGLRVLLILLLILVIFCILSSLLSSQMFKKEQEVADVTKQIQDQIDLANSDKDKIDQKANEYKSMTQALQDINDRQSDINQSRNIIPNLLNQIMFVVPENVQVTSIENPSDKHIVIEAQAAQYDQLGYFKAKLKSDGILTNVVSNSGVSDGDAVKVTIEGDLP